MLFHILAREWLRVAKDSMSRAAVCALLALGLFGAGCSKERRAAAAQTAPQANPPPHTQALPPEDGQWTMPAKDYANTRFSGLADINTANVQRLQLAWAFSTGAMSGHEAQPLVVNGTMYYVTPFPNVLYALDLSRSGALKWRYNPQPADGAKGVACCDLVNRGAAYADGRVFYATLDNHVVAVDAGSGTEVWKTKVGEINIGETITMAPLVAKGKVLVGNSGGEFGVRGWIKALDAGSGAVVWTAFSTGPDADCLIGANFTPFYRQDQGKDLGATTWPQDHWKIGGGNVWGWISYDPDLDLIYYGTANPGPWNPDLRPGDNKWTASLFARRPDTGDAIWAYQWTPHDVFDYDGVNESILADLPIAGQMRQTLLRAERNGLFYVLDRATGEVLSAEPYIFTNVVNGVDYRTGRPIEDMSNKPGFGHTARNICPAVPGGKDWEPMAYSPKSGLVYIPAINLCMDMRGVEANYIAGTPYAGHQTLMYAGPGGHRGEFVAWDPVNAKKRWAIKENFPVYRGALATAGDVVFYGTMDRALGGARHYRGGIVAISRGLGHHLVSNQLSRPGGQAVRRRGGRGRRLGHEGSPELHGRGGTIYVFSLP
jgi:PQQ-dependent dehydrogenase (methanol/ethanol family)